MARRILVLLALLLASEPVNAQEDRSYNVCERFPEYCIPGDEATGKLGSREHEYNVCEVWPEACDIAGGPDETQGPRTIDFCEVYPGSCVLVDPEGLRSYIDGMILKGF
jgi:hypothetical protein